MYQPHYRDRLLDRIFKKTEFKDLFKSWEGGHLVMWRWSSLVECLRALKRRQGPLQMHWDEDKYCERSNLEDDQRSRAKSAKIENSSEKNWSKGDATKFSKIIKDSFFWCYVEPWFR